MVHLIIVSHCHSLAEGVKELAGQMAQDQTSIIAIGGITDETGQLLLGTDALQIVDAIRQNWTDDGFLLLVDLGSAVISAELALEMLEPEERARCLISNAPLVEGAIVAAMEASLMHGLEVVNQAAEAVRTFDKVNPRPVD